LNRRFDECEAWRFRVGFGIKPLIPKEKLSPPEPTMRQERTVQVILVESVRVDGKPRQKHIAFLGSLHSGEFYSHGRLDLRVSQKVRYDKLRSNFRGFVKLAVTAIWLKPLIRHHSLATVVGLVRGRERRIRSRRH
jgi:hypothetical protein